jgi:GNAT superfamily N-acetyltransferase
MTIREYKAEDREAVEKCLFQLQEEDYNRYPDFWVTAGEATPKYLPYLLEKIKGKGELLVAEMDGHITGMISLLINDEKDNASPCYKVKRSAYITDLVVLKKYQKKNIGQELIKSAESFAIKNGAEYIALDVQFGNSAVEFYHKQGFTERSMWMDKKLS